ncbi:glycosyltransferase family 39 protein [Tunturiibacter gelidoferens]|uniref:Glycosyltransferase family 39 protein n=1 Tax=Tunturiibacter gelidiferens TaxID=3069689 RepID=A0AAU7YZD7_9BACT
MFARIRKSAFGPALCGLFLVLAIVVSHPVAEMGLDDDWSYIWSARVLADTGHVVYNGWSAAMLGWQLYLGALFFKIFGFSFFIARVSVLVVAVATIMLAQRLLVRLGVNEWNATVGALMIALSPVFLSVAFSFMSDVPGFFCIVLCFYSCARAIQASTTRKAIGWLVFAALSNAVGGTVRQLAWLGALVMVPSVAWHLRRRAGIPIVAAALWLISVGMIGWSMYWFRHQPYSLTDALVHIPHGRVGGVLKNIVLRNSLAICFFVLPIITAFIVKLPFRDRLTRFEATALLTAFAVAGLLGLIFSKQISLELEFTSSTVINGGLTSGSGILGVQPDVLPYDCRMVLTLLVLAALSGFILFLLNVSKIQRPHWKGKATFTWSSTFAMFGPFTMAYIVLLVTRTNIFDRYLIPLIFVAVVGLLRLYEERVGGRLPLLTVALILMFGAFGVAELHDLYARDRAVLAITNEVLSTGVTKSEIRAGFEYDAWTELENSRYVNDSRLMVPTGAYKTHPMRQGLSPACQSWFSGLMPSLNIHYALAYDQSTCYETSSFAPVSFQSWLPSHNRTLYVQRVP